MGIAFLVDVLDLRERRVLKVVPEFFYNFVRKKDTGHGFDRIPSANLVCFSTFRW